MYVSSISSKSYLNIYIYNDLQFIAFTKPLFLRVFFFLFRKQPKTFAFDHCFYSLDRSLPHFASQKTVFDCLGRDILDNAFDGYNACIFAYGQTGQLIDINQLEVYFKCFHFIKKIERKLPQIHICLNYTQVSIAYVG